MIRRSISFDAPSPVKLQLYISHVRSILEYCSPLWSPANVKDILLLESVQRHATKYIKKNILICHMQKDAYNFYFTTLFSPRDY